MNTLRTQAQNSNGKQQLLTFRMLIIKVIDIAL